MTSRTAKPVLSSSRSPHASGANWKAKCSSIPSVRGLYSTDASIYQVEPIGACRSEEPLTDVFRALEIATEAGLSVTPRGAGTSQSGQAIGEWARDGNEQVPDRNRRSSTPTPRPIRVQPGVVLDRLNRELEPHGLFFPVDVSTASRATLGGMAANNSAGARSIRYGMMVDNVRRVSGALADGTPVSFGLEVPTEGMESELASTLATLRRREDAELERRIPKVMRRVAGYNLDRISPRRR